MSEKRKNLTMEEIQDIASEQFEQSETPFTSLVERAYKKLVRGGFTVVDINHVSVRLFRFTGMDVLSLAEEARIKQLFEQRHNLHCSYINDGMFTITFRFEFETTRGG